MRAATVCWSIRGTVSPFHDSHRFVCDYLRRLGVVPHVSHVQDPTVSSEAYVPGGQSIDLVLRQGSFFYYSEDMGCTRYIVTWDGGF